MEHNAALAMHKQLGFPDKWVQWVDSTLRSGSLAVLLNGVPRKKSYVKEGFDKEIHYPTLPFVIATDLLQYIINNATFLGILSPPFESNSLSDFPSMQYVDDTLIIMKAS